MTRSTRTHTFFTTMGILAGISACQAEAPDELEPRVGPRPEADDIGSRRYAPESSLQRSLCPLGVGCSTADVNRDGKDDLVRFDSFGVFGPPGNVEVAYSNGWDFGPMRTVADGVCIDESGCTIADVDGDGIPDLIRFIRNGGDNPVEVYLGNVGPFGEDLRFLDPTPWVVGLCAMGQHCNAADVDGDGKADLIAFVGGQDGQVLVSLSQGTQGLPVVEWANNLCVGDSSRCRMGDVDADGRVDVIELDGQVGSARVALALPGGGFALPQWWADDIVFPSEATFQLGDFDGDFDVDVLVITPQSNGLDPLSCSGSCDGPAPGGCWCDDLCTGYGDCCADRESICVTGNTCEGACGGAAAGGCWCDELCSEYGDCCTDYEPLCDPAEPTGRVQIWPAMGNFFGTVFEFDSLGCEPGLRCWAADVTGDGRVDLVSVDDLGTVALWPSEDVLDRLERDAMRLSLLRADWERRRAEQARRVFEDLVREAVPLPEWMADLPAFAGASAPPPLPPTPSDPATPFEPLPELEPWSDFAPGAIDGGWLTDQRIARVAEIEASIAEVFAALPAESGLLWTADQLRWQRALGKVVAARTSIYAPALGIAAPSRDGACSNAVVYDRISEDGLDRHEGSYISRYYDGLRETDLNDRMWASVPALTGIVEGMRCLSQYEVAALEEAFVRAVLVTMEDLLARGHAPMAQILWDQALPVELLLFDGTKSFTMPKGWQMLQVRIESGALVIPTLPPSGSDFDIYLAEDTTTCSTVRCQLYKGAARATVSGQNLTLDTLGAWLPDLGTRERLRRSQLDPQVLLDAMVNLEVLGEGDCPLIELTPYSPTCKSQRTCELSETLAAAAATEGLEVLPGMLSSPFTHLGTRRSDLAGANECGAGTPGGSLPNTCMGPKLRGRRGSFYPLDPELDAIMTCTLETYDGETPSAEAFDLDFGSNPGCLLYDKPPSTTPDPTEVVTNRVIDASDSVKELFWDDNSASADEYGFNRDTIANLIVAKTGATYDQVISAMARVAYQGFDNLRFSQASNGTFARGSVNMASRWSGYTVDVFMGSLQDQIDMFTDGVDPSVGSAMVDQFLFTVMLREGIGMVLDTLAVRGETTATVPEDREDLNDAIGVGRSCDPASGGCSSTCGYTDARMARFSECLSGGAPEPFDPCVTAEDYCSDRRNGNLEYDLGLGCEAPALPPLPPLCTAVNCGDGSDLAGECCGGGGGGGTPPPYVPRSPGPGPHPGSPDGPLPLTPPGGPGGISIPPLPPIPGF